MFILLPQFHYITKCTHGVLFFNSFYEKILVINGNIYHFFVGGDNMINNKDLNYQYTIFSDNVKYYRKQSRLTQEQLAELADLSISYVKQIESNNEYKNISLTTILKISKALDIGVTTLFYNRK